MNTNFPDRTGQKVPSVTLYTRKNDDWKKINSDELFKGRKVVLFALPGAYTPTCSASHLPRYEELASEFYKYGVDDIYCLSVNDAFVMSAWAKDQGADEVKLIPDGNGDFSEKMGYLVEKDDLGFGKRSWRYSMLVNDGVIEKMFVEPNEPGDPFKVSDADTMLEYIAPEAERPKLATLFTKPGCPHCLRAKSALLAKGIRYEEIVLRGGISFSSLKNITGKSTVPQIYMDGEHIGSGDDLQVFLSKMD